MATKPPNSGPSHGRMRNTNRNLFSKFPNADPFPLGPTDSVGFGIQAQNLRFSNQVQRASLSAQATMLRSQHRMSRRGAIEAGIAGTAEVSGAMADRGIIGSTVHQAENENVKATTQGAIADSRFSRDAGLMGVNTSRLEADAALRMGLTQIGMQRRAAQRGMALGAFGSGGQNPWGY